MLKAQVAAQLVELLLEQLGAPHVWVARRLGVAAADLVIVDDLAVVLAGELVQAPQVPVRVAGTTVDGKQGQPAQVVLAHDAVPRLVALEGHVAFDDLELVHLAPPL